MFYEFNTRSSTKSTSSRRRINNEEKSTNDDLKFAYENIEVPIMFPSDVNCHRRYVIDEGNRRLKHVQEFSSFVVDQTGNSTTLLQDFSPNEVYKGSSSISRLSIHVDDGNSIKKARGNDDNYGNMNDAILTTSAAIENPNVLCVSLTWNAMGTSNTSKNVTMDFPVMIELDITSVISLVVKVESFYIPSRDGESGHIRMVLVGQDGVVVVLYFNLQNLTPIEEFPIEVMSIREILSNDSSIGSIIRDNNSAQAFKSSDHTATFNGLATQTKLFSPMIGFISENLILVAYSPYLLVLDIHFQSICTWSETQCLEGMKSRISTIGSIFSKAGDLLLGKIDGAGQLLDMPPTAALCVARKRETILDDTIYAFTLHSDSSLRRWTIIDQKNPYPYEVHNLQLTDNYLPPSSIWCGELSHSIQLSAGLYEQIYALAIYIQTEQTAPIPVEDCQQQQNDGVSSSTNLKLFVVHGGQDTNIQPALMSSQEMVVPNEATSLIGMTFGTNRCALSAMFHHCQQQRASHHVTTLQPTILQLTYPPSMVSIINSKPEYSSVDCYLDGVAKTEFARIVSLAFGTNLAAAHINSSGISNSILEYLYHQLDSQYMKYLFRPSHLRGSGNILSPSKYFINKALQKLIHGYNGGERYGDACNTSIELKTLRAIHEWRNKDERNIMTSSTPLRKKTRRIGTPSPSFRGRGTNESICIPTPNNTTHGTDVSVYDSFVAAVNDENEEEQQIDLLGSIYVDDNNSLEYNNKDLNAADSMDDYEEEEWKEKLYVHEQRWKRLLSLIWEEERFLRSPLCFLMVDNSQILLRAGFTSIIKESPTLLSSSSLSFEQVIDQAALKLIASMEANKECVTQLYEFEQKVWHIVVEADLESANTSKLHDDSISLSLDRAFLEGNILSPREEKFLKKCLDSSNSKISSQKIVQWLQETPKQCMSPELALLFGKDNEVRSNDRSRINMKNVELVKNRALHCQIRQAICGFYTRCIDSARRLLLGRYLLLSFLMKPSNIGISGVAIQSETEGSVEEAAFCAYMRSISVLWTSSQLLKMPETAEDTSLSGGNRSTSKKNYKRLKLRFDGTTTTEDLATNGSNAEGDEEECDFDLSTGALGILSSRGMHEMTTALDVLLIYLLASQDCGIDSTSSITQLILSATKTLYSSSLQCPFPTKNDIQSGLIFRVLPELGALPPPSNATTSSNYVINMVASDHPRLALRLLMPIVQLDNSYSFEIDENDLSSNVKVTRKESFAECLLIESHYRSDSNSVTDKEDDDGNQNITSEQQMMMKACELLLDSSGMSAIMDNNEINLAKKAKISFERLKENATDFHKNTPLHKMVSDEVIIRLSQKLGKLIYGVKDDQNEETIGIIHNNEDKKISPNSIRNDIRRLCDLETTRYLFLPLIYLEGQLQAIPSENDAAAVEERQELQQVYEEDCTIVAPLLLHLSNLLRRLDILEHNVNRHRTRSKNLNYKTGGVAAMIDFNDLSQSHKRASSLLLEFIEKAIRDLSSSKAHNSFNISEYNGIYTMMPEYNSLFSRLFHNALTDKVWSIAYDACVMNPSLQRRVTNFKLLVIAMVDAGCLNELLSKCSTLATSHHRDREGSSYQHNMDINEGNEDCIDLYGIAAETLLESCAQRDFSYMQNTSDDASRISDYKGALYSLHVSQGKWKRAAQALDFRYVEALKVLGMNVANNSNFNKKRKSYIVNNLVLASCGATNALSLIRDEARRFIISGEHGQYPVLPTDKDGEEDANSMQIDDEDSYRSKRRRSGNKVHFQNNENNYKNKSNSDNEVLTKIEHIDRNSDFMGIVDFENRAIKSIIYKSLVVDITINDSNQFLAGTDNDITKEESIVLFLSDNGKSDAMGASFLNAAFASGHYLLGLLLAKCIDKTAISIYNRTKENGGQQRCGNFFYDTISYMLCTYLIPLISANNNDRSTDNDAIMARPSLLQLRRALDDISIIVSQQPPQPAFIASHRSSINLKKRYFSFIETASMAFIEKSTTFFCTKVNPHIVMNVADAILRNYIAINDNKDVQLPSWIHQLLMNGNAEYRLQCCRNDGLFARRIKSVPEKTKESLSPQYNDIYYQGDPSALLSLYTKNGMYVESCNLVSSILLCSDNNDQKDINNGGSWEQKIPSKLPERGNIDFIPYNKIDLLWNLIEIMLQRGEVENNYNKQAIINAKDELGTALQKHFELLSISESGVLSARTLRSNSISTRSNHINRI